MGVPIMLARMLGRIIIVPVPIRPMVMYAMRAVRKMRCICLPLPRVYASETMRLMATGKPVVEMTSRTV